MMNNRQTNNNSNIVNNKITSKVDLDNQSSKSSLNRCKKDIKNLKKKIKKLEQDKTGHEKPIPARISHIDNNPYLKDFSITEYNSTHSLNHVQDQGTQVIEVPLHILHDLPGVRATHFNLHKEFFYLLDSGSKHNIINGSIFRDISKTGLNLNKYQHNVHLSAHNGSNILLEKYGIFLPIKLRDIYGKQHNIIIPCLIEKDMNSLPILGFDAIKELKINFKEDFTTCTIRKSGNMLEKYHMHQDSCHSLTVDNHKIQLHNTNASVADGEYLMKSLNNCVHMCPINHIPEISCLLAKKAIKQSKVLDELQDIFQVQPIVSDEQFEKRISVRDGLITSHDTFSDTSRPILLEDVQISESKATADSKQTEWPNSLANEQEQLVSELCHNIVHTTSLEDDLATIFQNITHAPDAEKETLTHKQVETVDTLDEDNLITLTFKTCDNRCITCTQDCRCPQLPRIRKNYETLPRIWIKKNKQVIFIFPDQDPLHILSSTDIMFEFARLTEIKNWTKFKFTTVNFNETGLDIFDRVISLFDEKIFKVSNLIRIKGINRENHINIGSGPDIRCNPVLNIIPDLNIPDSGSDYTEYPDLNQDLNDKRDSGFLDLNFLHQSSAVHNVNIDKNSDVEHQSVKTVIKNASLAHSTEGIPNKVLDPPSIRFNVMDANLEKDLASMIKNSDPNMSEFLNLLFNTYDQVYAHHAEDIGIFQNPNFVLDLQVEDHAKLPKHKPFNTDVHSRKACARVMDSWERSGIITKSNNRSHASRLLVVKKHVSPTDHQKIIDRLKQEGIELTGKDSRELFSIDPDLLTLNEVQKLYRVVLDARQVNLLTEPVVPLQQSAQLTLFDLLMNLGEDHEDFNPTLPKKLSIENVEDLEKKVYTNTNDKHYIPWEPIPLDKSKTEKLDNFLKTASNFQNDKKQLLFSSLDIKAAHNSIKCSQNASNILNFVSPNMTFYKFIQSPFGLSQISNVFNSSLIAILDDLVTKCLVFIYADDVIILSYGTQQDHAYLVTEVIKRLQINGIKISINKSFFFIRKFRYLGFEMDHTGIQLTDERVKALYDFQRPENLKSLQRYLGSLQYVASFIPDLAIELTPLTDLLQKDQPYIWGEDQEKCFEKIRNIVKSKPKLFYYRRGEPIVMYCDSSSRGGAAVVFQGSKEQGTYRPILFLSRKYNKNQVSLYSALELEISNILDSLEKVGHFIDSNIDLSVQTDAKALIFAMRAGRLGNQPRLVRLTAKLSLFPVNWKIEYCKPTLPELQIADALSRQYDTEENMRNAPAKMYRKIQKSDINHTLSGTFTFNQLFQLCEENPEWVKLPPELDVEGSYPFKPITQDQDKIPGECFINHLTAPLVNILSPSELLSTPNIILEQRKDPNFSNVLSLLTKENLNLHEKLSTDGFFLKNQLLMKKLNKAEEASSKNSLLVIPDSLLAVLIANFHILLGHIGQTKLYNILRQSYFNENMNKKIKEMVSACHACLLSQPANYRYNPISPYLNDLYPFYELSMDHFKMNKVKNYEYVLIVLDTYSQFAFLFPCTNQKSTHVARFLEQIFSTFGAPHCVKSDNAQSLLKAQTVKDIMSKYNVKRRLLTLPYHPSHNAQVERTIGTMRKLLRAFETSTHNNWVELLPKINLIYNTTPRQFPNQLFLSPFQRLLNRDPPQHIINPKTIFQDQDMIQSAKSYEEIRELVNKHMLSLKEEHAKKHNAKARTLNLQVGDIVLYRDMQPPKALERAKKTLNPYHNRLYLLKYLKGTKATIEDLVSGTHHTVFSHHLKKYLSRPEYFQDLPLDIQRQMGSSFNINFNIDTRSKILKTLQNAGFDISLAIPFDKDIQKSVSNVDDQDSQIDKKSRYDKMLSLDDPVQQLPVLLPKPVNKPSVVGVIEHSDDDDDENDYAEDQDNNENESVSEPEITIDDSTTKEKKRGNPLKSIQRKLTKIRSNLSASSIWRSRLRERKKDM